MYKEQFSSDEVNYLKASEIREFRKLDNAIAGTLLVVLAMFFMCFVSFVSLLIWGTKLTLFLFIIVVVPSLLLDIVYIRLFKAYKKKIKSAKDRIKEEM